MKLTMTVAEVYDQVVGIRQFVRRCGHAPANPHR